MGALNSNLLLVAAAVIARILPMTLLLPGLAGLHSGWLIRIGLAIGISALTFPLVIDQPWLETAPALWEIVWENALCGLAVGATVRLLIGALAWAGDWLSEIAGLGLHQPGADASGSGATPLGRLYGWLGVLIFWSLGGISMAADALLRSFHALPLSGIPLSDRSWTGIVTGVLDQSFELAVRIGSPVCLSLMAASIAIAMMQRSMPGWGIGRVQLAGNWLVLFVAMILTVGTHNQLILERVQFVLAAIQTRLAAVV